MTTGHDPVSVGLEGAISRLVRLATAWADGRGLGRTDLHTLLDEVEVTALRYAAALDALERAGIRIDDDRRGPEADGDEDAGGLPVDGFGAFVDRTAHKILTFE